MTPHEAYNACHEIMLGHPHYVPGEGKEMSYVLLQVAETDTRIEICGHIVDPAIPPNGSPLQFIGMPLHKQMVLFSLDKINKVLHDAHEFLGQLQRFRKDDETDEEFVERIKRHIEHSASEI